MSVAASIFATRYVSAVGVTALIYDHGLTCKDEVNLIWTNPAAGPLSRLGFLVNRYLTEATAIYVAYMLSGGSHGLQNQDCRIFIWVHSIVATIFIALSHFIVMSRVYVLWDRRRSIKWILMGAFGVAISITMIFAILAAHQVQAELEYDPDIHMCVFSKKPPGLPVMLGALTGLDLFIILMTIFNALDRPHEKQADVVTALQHDGARMFVCLFLLRLISFIIAIVGSPAYCFVTITVVWMMCSVVTSRIQLRVEELRSSRHTFRPEELELSLFF